MDDGVLNHFTMGLPIPDLNELQSRLASEIVRLEGLCESTSVHKADAVHEIWRACIDLAQAMDVAGLPRNSYGEILRPYDYGDHDAEKAYDAARAPWYAAEDWIIWEGSGTGSARAIAICYIGIFLGLKMRWEEVYGSILDKERALLVTNLVRARRLPDFPSNFWRVFVTYRGTTAREWESQGCYATAIAR